ncbi:UNVERIFIED_CONTAM: DExH-box ATP-dependent RNA helicase DExH12 [Sesamum latifolium]|uniref:DExH-box ATP-dependent RNA helicase DExH12 n=1 Tax=Sesamum latifolium TaxID=2727402 RepID=A0AAW2WGK3_9LAMI
MLKKQYIDEDHTLNFTIPIYEPLPPQYFINVVSDRWLTMHTVTPVSFRHLILPEKYPPPSQAFQSCPDPVFTIFYNLDDNVLVVALTGSRKTVCSEFATLRNHQKDLIVSYGLCIYYSEALA